MKSVKEGSIELSISKSTQRAAHTLSHFCERASDGINVIQSEELENQIVDNMLTLLKQSPLESKDQLKIEDALESINNYLQRAASQQVIQEVTPDTAFMAQQEILNAAKQSLFLQANLIPKLALKLLG